MATKNMPEKAHVKRLTLGKEVSMFTFTFAV